MADVHGVYITLNELLDHAEDLYNPSSSELDGLEDAIRFIWFEFQEDQFIQDSVTACVCNRAQLLEDDDEWDDDGDGDTVCLTNVDTALTTLVRSFMETYSTKLSDDDVVCIIVFSEVLYDYILEYMDITLWLGDINLIEKVGERFSFYFG